MATIASLAVSLTARTSKFSRGFKNAGKTVSRFSGQLGVVQSKIRGLATGLAAAAAGGGLGLLVKNSFQSIDALAKVSDRLGISTEKLAGLELAGKRTGVEFRTLTLGFQRMTRRVSQAAQGTGEAQAALKELGIDAVKLNKLAPDEQFNALAIAMGKVAVQSDKVRLAQKLFDSEGVALLNTLAAGQKGLAGFQKEAQALGLTLSRDQAAQVEAANDAIDRVKDSVRAIGRTLAINLAGPLESAARKFTDFFAKVGGANGIFNRLKAVIEDFRASVLQAFSDIFKFFKFDSLAKGFQGAAIEAIERAEKLQQKAEQLSQASIRNVAGGGGGGGGGRAGEATRISLGRTAIGALGSPGSRPQEITSDQLGMISDQLGIMIEIFRGQVGTIQ